MISLQAGTSSQQNALLIRVYGWYRVVLSLLLLAVLLGGGANPIVGRHDPELFGWLCAGYFALSLLLLVWVTRRDYLGMRQLFAIFCIDIAVLTILSHVSGGIRSGLAPLLLVVVATAGMLLRGQIALLVAAIATIALLADTFWLIGLGRDEVTSLLSTATLGVLAFVTSIALQSLSQRLRTTQLLAQQRAQDVSKLQHLNHLIVQRMRTGILVVDSLRQIKMANVAAAELLHAGELSRLLEQGRRPPLSGPLERRLLDWQRNPFADNPPFAAGEGDEGPELLARFTRLDDETGDTLIFLEDCGQIAQRAQQLKLAALGRLTASIAHEIRNPLGAVSHAAQLLQESPELAPHDRRLAEILHNHTRRMNTIIENILQLSRRTPPAPQRLQLVRWLEQFVDDYLEGCEGESEIEIQPRSPVEVTFDPSQLGQVLTNLLDNALRYSEKASGRRHAWLIVKQGPNRLPQLEVVDEGPGIADSEREKVFEPFFTTESKGNGLGLYIARELCEINQARLGYLRTLDGRSSFRISFSHPDRRPLINE